MQGKIRVAHGWSPWCRVAITVVAVAAAHLLQIPLEHEVPGEPFLLFFLVVIGSTLAFGARVGFVAVALSTLLSIFFFAPTGTLALRHASDLIKIEVYAILAGGRVIAFASFGTALIAASDRSDTLEQLHQKKSTLSAASEYTTNFLPISGSGEPIAVFSALASWRRPTTERKSSFERAVECTAL